MAKETDLLTVNRRIHLLRPNDATVYSSLLEEVGDDYFTIQLPMIGETVVPLHPGETVEVRLTTPEGRYVFNAEVLDREWDRIPLCRLAKPKEIERSQLREFVRWRVALDVGYEPITPEQLELPQLPEPQRKAITVDLGGGGLQMLVKEVLQVNTLLVLRLNLFYRRVQESITAVGKVRRCVTCEGEKPPRYTVGVSFERISERERDVIVGFIFWRMVAERQAGF